MKSNIDKYIIIVAVCFIIVIGDAFTLEIIKVPPSPYNFYITLLLTINLILAFGIGVFYGFKERKYRLMRLVLGVFCLLGAAFMTWILLIDWSLRQGVIGI